jgi:hypothetical protein
MLIHLGSWGFARYLGSFYGRDPISLIYGSIGVIPFFLVWVWLLWLFVLLGVEIAHVTQNFRSLVQAERDLRRETERPRLAAVDTAVELTCALARAHRPLSSADLADRGALTLRSVDQILGILDRAGIVAPLGSEWILARPADAIRTREVLEAWRAATAVRDGRTPLSVAVDDALERAVGPTIAEVAARWTTAAAEEEPAGSAETPGA